MEAIFEASGSQSQRASALLHVCRGLARKRALCVVLHVRLLCVRVWWGLWCVVARGSVLKTMLTIGQDGVGVQYVYICKFKTGDDSPRRCP